MRPDVIAFAAVVVAASFVLPGPAHARPLPDEVGKILREANDSERKSIENVLKRLYPDRRAQIDDLIDVIEDEEKARVASSKLTENWKGEVSLGANWSGGNSDQWDFNAGVDLQRKSPIWKHRISGYIDLSDRDGERTTERMGLSYRLRRDFKASPWFVFIYGDYERNRPQGISRRFTEVAGGGYQIIDTDDVDWEVSAGPALRQTRYVGAADESRFAVAVSTDLEYEFTDRLVFKTNSMVVLDEGNTSLNLETSLKNNLYGRFSGKVSFGANYESDPSQDKKKLDTYAQASIVIEM